MSLMTKSMIYRWIADFAGVIYALVVLGLIVFILYEIINNLKESDWK